MMEKFHVPSLFIGIQGVLSIYATGRQTGTALSIGAGITQIVPVDKGFAIPGTSTFLNLGGGDMRILMARMLTISGYTFNMANEFDHTQDIVEQFGYIALDFDRETESVVKRAKVEEKTYKLPDGEVITPRHEKFECPEVLFKPSILGPLSDSLNASAKEGIHKACHDSITKCDIEIHPLLYKNIVLSGGSSLFPGLGERLEKEVGGLAPSGTTVRVIAAQQRKNSVWIGGSILASLTTFQDMWITKGQYDEQGSSVIHKCPST